MTPIISSSLPPSRQVDSEDVAAKYKAWGWHVIEIDGCCPEAIRKALREAKATVGQPTLIIGKTIMGRGAVGPNGENYENRGIDRGTRSREGLTVCIDTVFIVLPH